MKTPDERVSHEYKRLMNGLDHWGSIDIIARRAKLPEAVVQRVMQVLQEPEVSKEICRNADTEEFLLQMEARIFSARKGFVWEAIEVVGKCGPPKGKGPNFERIYKDAQRDAQDALEEKFS